MSSTRQTHQVGQIKKLIDLNGDTVNFDINFQVSSRNKEPFQILVVDQTTLDSTPNLQYKNVENGSISGNIVHDKNVYQNHFLILRADNPCECDIEITKKELPKTPTQLPQQLPQQTQPAIQGPQIQKGGKKDGFNWVKIFLIIGVIVAFGIGLYLYSKKSDSPQIQQVEKSPVQTAPVEAGFKFYSPPKSSSRSLAESVGHKGNNLLDRLKRLNVN